MPGNSRPILITISLSLLLAFSIPAARGEERIPEITSDELMAHTKYLADDELQGRASGSEGALMAAAYIAEEFDRIGLKPVGDDGTFFQGFTIPRGFEVLPETLILAMKGKKEILFRLNKDIYPLHCSSPGRVEAEAVFAGYGISAPDLNYDDYEEIDVTDKIAIVLRGLPNDRSNKNPFNGTRAARQFASFQAKLDTAASMGAVGLIVVNDPANYSSKSKDTLEGGGRRDEVGKIPGFLMTYGAARKLFSSTGITLTKYQRLIDSSLKPRSREVDNATIRLNAALERKELMVRNVVGLLESTAQDRKDEVVVVGGHFDHIGLGEFGSLGGSKAKGKVHNGADDNASGTAAVMEIAGFLKPLENELKRNVLFICFTGEEMGLLGAEHYVGKPIIPIEKTAAMINLDMVGYLAKTGSLNLYGMGTSPDFEKLIKEANRSFRVKIKEGKGTSGRSDHYPFYKKGLPFFFFITGLHKNYHRPEDDWKLIDKKGFAKVAGLAGQVAMELAMLEAKPVFTPVSEGSLDTGPYLGISIENREGAIFVSDVAKKSPAYRGGLKKDDQILEVDERETRSVSIFYGVWAGVREGAKVSFLVRREGRLRTVRVTLKK